jgi:hypothetical protein
VGNSSGDENGSDPMKFYWEIIADNLKKAGWSLGYVSTLNASGKTIWIADAHRDDGKRFVVRADEKLTAFVELESRFALVGSLTCTANLETISPHRAKTYEKIR